MKDTSAGWVKYERSPVLGGDLGTCFDVSILRENGKFRLWFSWRPQKSIPLVESTDVINWGKPVFVLRPNDATDWESDINRPAIVKRDDGYRMWYNGGEQNEPNAIGYATSPDGFNWTKLKENPIFSADPNKDQRGIRKVYGRTWTSFEEDRE